MRPEYYVVPSKDVYAKFARFESAKTHLKPTKNEVNDIVKRIKSGETAWSIVDALGIFVRVIRDIAKNNKLKIKYDQGGGEDFPFSFYIRKEEEATYSDRWDSLFTFSKIIGDFGEFFVCDSLSKLGFEVLRVDHTGLDVIAYSASDQRRLGITVKSRTRKGGKESDAVNIFSHQKGKDDRQKLLAACEAFLCEPWIAVYVENLNTNEWKFSN